MDLAVTSAEELSTAINLSKESAATFVIAAQKLLRDSKVIDKEFVTADVALEKRKSMHRCSTGSKALDEPLLGGIETRAVTEFYGEFGSGKSQICHTLCVTARQPTSLGGSDGGIIYIDTESTFRSERVQEIAIARGLDHLQVLRHVSVCKVCNSSHLELMLKDLGRYIQEFKARLVVIDGIISLHRAEFVGRGTLADRQQRLNSMLHRLLRLAEIFNIAIAITNQVQATPDTFFGVTLDLFYILLNHNNMFRHHDVVQKRSRIRELKLSYMSGLRSINHSKAFISYLYIMLRKSSSNRIMTHPFWPRGNTWPTKPYTKTLLKRIDYANTIIDDCNY